MSIELKRVEEFAVITLNRPEALNALSFGLIRELGQLFEQVADSDARALLITGAGNKAFCAGADIKELAGRTLVSHKQGTELGQWTFARLDRLPMPSLAVINGYAFGGGLELALACTARIATRNAKMGLPEIKLGLIPGYGGTQRLPRVVGEARALEMIMTGRTVDAEEALRIGLVNEVVPHAQLMERAEKMARHICTLPPVAVRMMKEFVVRFGDLPTDQAWHVQNLINSLLHQTTMDAEEGRRAFNAKRPPNFTGALRRRGEPWPEFSEEDAKRLDDAYRSGEF